MMKILIIDDDPAFNNLLMHFLQKEGYEVVQTFHARDANKHLKKSQFDMALVDYQLPDMNGLEFISAARIEYPSLKLILITNYSDLRVAVNSIKLGAFEFVSKPIIPEELLRIIRLAFSGKSKLANKSEENQEINYIIGENEKTQQVWEHLKKVSPTNLSVFIRGESGTGKEYLARAIHQNSRRNKAPFIAIDCGTLNHELAGSELFGHVKGSFTGAFSDKTGVFEEANGGTLFLDEVGNLSIDVQIKLLRAIQEGRIRRIGDSKEITTNVRIVCATNEDMWIQIEKGLFRNDLFHRLNEFELHIPPLRERKEDLKRYIDYFLREAEKELQIENLTISPTLLTLLQEYNWPGNLRELKNIIRRAALVCKASVLTVSDLPNGFTFQDGAISEDSNKQSDNESLNLKENIQHSEREMIQEALLRFKFNKTLAAEALNINRSTLYQKIKLYKLQDK